ncbi:MAG: LamG domain-containing protein, partial [Thermoguttaceae bacterium]
VFEPAELKRLRRATISARFCAAKDGAGSCAIFGDTEFRGIEFAVDYNLKTLRLWATVNNAPYTILDAPIEFGKWYDAAATFDGSNLVLYLDGKEVARAELKGQLTHPTDTTVNAFTVGADIAPGGAGSYFFKGRVERARLYSWALTPQQVAEIAK